MSVVFAGERGSFAELAAIEYFGARYPIVNVELFEDVFTSVQKKNALYGIIPIENSRAGSVHRNYDLLLETGCYIIGELYLKIGQCLIANSNVTLRKIRHVYSHPQALAQCRKYMRKHPSLATHETVNTAAAVRKIKEESILNGAAIASMQAAIDFDMQILAHDIQDDANNMTRFLILSKQPSKKISTAAPVKSSIVFSTKNIPGSLFKSLAVFSLREIDLYKIESRPMFGEGFQYLFYLDFAGAATAPPQKHALAHLQEMTTFYRFLGSYPAGKTHSPDYRKRN